MRQASGELQIIGSVRSASSYGEVPGVWACQTFTKEFESSSHSHKEGGFGAGAAYAMPVERLHEGMSADGTPFLHAGSHSCTEQGFLGGASPICKHNARMIGLFEKLHEIVSLDRRPFSEASQHGLKERKA